MTPLERYVVAHCSPADPVLDWVERETHFHTLHPRMLSARPIGDFLSFLSVLLRPRRVLEIGTFTGYASLCLAQGLAPDGRVDTLEANDELEPLIRRTLEKAGHPPVRSLIGPALELIPQLDEVYDLVYIDADKREYRAYFEAILPKVRPGGLILADNVLWDGHVVDPQYQDAQTRGIRDFNAAVQAHPAVHNLLLPLGDGMMLIRVL